MLKLVRLATLYFKPIPEGWRSWEMNYASARIKTMGEWEIDGRLRLLVVSELDLHEMPLLSDDGTIIVPEGPRKEAERAIEMAANTIAVSERCQRSISSPSPYVAFLPTNSANLAWLESTNGIKMEGRVVTWFDVPVGVSDYQLGEALSDRPDGTALLSEALAQDHATGRFHELIRLFERAFAEASTSLVTPLASFLHGFGENYTEAEVKQWVVAYRHPATHADKKEEFLLEGDIRPILPRMEQAAYDVLFNKEQWRSASSGRRSVWSPVARITTETGPLTITRDATPTMEAQLLDSFGSYPMDLTAGLTELPQGWWAKMADTKATIG